MGVSFKTLILPWVCGSRCESQLLFQCHVCLLLYLLLWGWLTGSEVQSNKAGAWQYLGRHGAGGAKSSTSSSEGC